MTIKGRYGDGPEAGEAPAPPDLAGYGLVFVNSSAGKDSQALVDFLVELAAEHAAHYGLRFEKVTRPQGDLLWQIRKRGKFPDAARRFCTAHHKQNQVRRVMTRLVAEVREADAAAGREPRRVRVLNCMGMRSEESPARRKRPAFRHDAYSSNGRRHVDEWLPLKEWTVGEVWARIARAGTRVHPAYSWGMPRLSCSFCLAGETKVVTREGLKSIGSLAGGRHPLLVPKVTDYGLSGHGTFSEVEVKSFGEQRLWRVEMHRRRQRKTVYTTAEHRWLVTEGKLRPPKPDGRHDGYEYVTAERTTSSLQPGNKLRPLLAQAPTKTGMVPFAVAQGFVFGDGGKGQDERPATLTIYDEGKDGALLPFFAAHEIRPVTANNKPAKTIYGLPRLWKVPPDLRESRPFLLSWLAGYFAADGCVTEDASARLDSASIEALRVVRDVAAVCGIGYGPIRAAERVGTGTRPTPLYSITLDTRALPSWFFLINSHQRRIAVKAGSREKHQLPWVVDSVTETDRVEEVYCAVVPGARAFALSEDLMTGNCVISSKAALVRAARLRPGLAREYADVEREIGHDFRLGLPMAKIVELAEAEEAAGNELAGEVEGWAA